MRRKRKESDAITRGEKTSGSKAAAVISAGIGVAVFGFSRFLLDADSPVQGLLGNFNFSLDTGHLSLNNVIASAGSWLSSWGLLYLRWRRKKKRIKRLLIIGIVLLILAFSGFLPFIN